MSNYQDIRETAVPTLTLRIPSYGSLVRNVPISGSCDARESGTQAKLLHSFYCHLQATRLKTKSLSLSFQRYPMIIFNDNPNDNFKQKKNTFLHSLYPSRRCATAGHQGRGELGQTWAMHLYATTPTWGEQLSFQPFLESDLEISGHRPKEGGKCSSPDQPGRPCRPSSQTTVLSS